jgi:hypothetical protein
LLIFNDSTLIALLPANRAHDTLISHGGLTYGGFIVDSAMKISGMMEMFEAVLSYLQQNSFTTVVYKPVPHIYHKVPAEADGYGLFHADAVLQRRSLLSVIDQRSRVPFQERRIRGVKKAQKNGLSVALSDDLARYWDLLSDVLQATYQAKPVHSLSEILSLKANFPNNIKLYACLDHGSMMAGVLVFESDQVARAQYIAATEQGKALGALDLIFNVLLNDIYLQKPYFDFGTSDGQESYLLNKGLIEQKEGFGARAVSIDSYRIDLSTWQPERFRKVRSE